EEDTAPRELGSKRLWPVSSRASASPPPLWEDGTCLMVFAADCWRRVLEEIEIPSDDSASSNALGSTSTCVLLSSRRGSSCTDATVDSGVVSPGEESSSLALASSSWAGGLLDLDEF